MFLTMCKIIHHDSIITWWSFVDKIMRNAQWKFTGILT